MVKMWGKTLLVPVEWGNRVMPAPAPGVAAQNAPDTQPYAFDDSMCFHGLYKIGGAAGLEPASAVGSAKNMQRFADESFVE